ncbi:hypothetical protein [Kitasatospora sp. NPDC059327]|uniref:hypothetical protein n=1 Tax=Kitasatospora sp. NPDC059327 TaxID=3346803 RepID=UPI0036B5BF82
MADDAQDNGITQQTAQGRTPAGAGSLVLVTGGTGKVTGPRPLSFADVAAELSAATGREIRFAEVTVEQYREVLAAAGLPGGFADLFTMILDGRNARPADGVRRALGRAPRDFAAYAREAAASGVWKA